MESAIAAVGVAIVGMFILHLRFKHKTYKGIAKVNRRRLLKSIDALSGQRVSPLIRLNLLSSSTTKKKLDTLL